MLDLTKSYCTRSGATAQAITAPDGFLYGWISQSPGHVGRAKWDAEGKYWPAASEYPPSPLPWTVSPNDLVNATSAAPAAKAVARPRLRAGEVLAGRGFIVDQDGQLFQFNGDLGTIQRVTLF